MTRDEAQRRVGQADSLPTLDIFGGQRFAGWSSRGVAGGGVVCYPPGSNAARVNEAIAEIEAALKSAPRSKPGATQDDKQDDNG